MQTSQHPNPFPDHQLLCTQLQRLEKVVSFSFALLPTLKLFFWVNRWIPETAVIRNQEKTTEYVLEFGLSEITSNMPPSLLEFT